MAVNKIIKYKIRGLDNLVEIGKTTRNDIDRIVSSEKIDGSEYSRFKVEKKDRYATILYERTVDGTEVYEESTTYIVFDENEKLRCIDSDSLNILEEIHVGSDIVIFDPNMGVGSDSEIKNIIDDAGIVFINENDVDVKYVCKDSMGSHNKFVDNIVDAYKYPMRSRVCIYKQSDNTVIWCPDNINYELMLVKDNDNISEWIGRDNIYGDKLPWYRQVIK